MDCDCFEGLQGLLQDVWDLKGDLTLHLILLLGVGFSDQICPYIDACCKGACVDSDYRTNSGNSQSIPYQTLKNRLIVIFVLIIPTLLNSIDQVLEYHEICNK